MARIADIIQPRDEVIQRTFQGVLRAHKADANEDTLESEPHRFFDVTFPSNRIKQLIEHINDKIRGRNPQGALVLTGPYGSGKSHGLITLYHLFKHSELGRQWAKRWGIHLSIPDTTDAVIVSTLNEDPRLLWEPIFKRAGREDLLAQVERFASIETIQELVKGKTIAVILDEIESWYVSMEKTNQDYLERNRSFLQCLLEVAADPEQQLFVFISTLGKGTSLEEILSRTSPPREDMSTTGDRERILLHRLFKTPIDSIDENEVRLVAGEYAEAYKNHLPEAEIEKIKQRIIRNYPFHPVMLNLLDNLYESVASQSVRGQMMVLAEAVANEFDKTDLLTVSDLNERAFRGMNLELVSRYELDATKRVFDSVSQALLRVVLMFSLNDVTGGASEKDVLLGCFKTSLQKNLTDMSVELESLVGKAVYLHRERGHWIIKGEENAIALIERESRNVSNDESERVIYEVLKNQVFGSNIHVFEIEKDDIPDDKMIRFVVLVKSYGSTKDLQELLQDFCNDKRWGNTLVFVIPLGEGPLENETLLEKAKRVVAAKLLKPRLPDASEKIDEILKEEQRHIRKEIESRYGYIASWALRTNGNLDIVLKRVPPDLDRIREISATDESQLEEWLLEKLNEEERGIKIEWLLATLKQQRGSPRLTDNSILYSLVMYMLKEGKLVVQGERGRYLSKSEVYEIRDEHVLLHPDNVPDARTGPESVTETPESGTPEELTITQVVKDHVQKGKKPVSRISRDFEGNSPTIIVSRMDSALNEETDLVVGFKLELLNPNLSKEEAIQIVETLPRNIPLRLILEVDSYED